MFRITEQMMIDGDSRSSLGKTVSNMPRLPCPFAPY